MNLRNTLRGEKEEQKNTITFSLDGETWTEISYTCDSISLATFLLNLVDVWNRMLEDEALPQWVIDEIRNKWKEDIENLSTK